MKKILLTAFVFWAKLLAAQEETTRSFVWGVTAGFESQPLGVQSLYIGEPERLQVEALGISHGASLGLFGRWRLWRGLAVQPALTFSSARATVHFSADGKEALHFSDLELPLHFVLTNPQGRSSLRGSFLLGARLGWNFATQSSKNLRLLHERLALDAGLGVEIRLKNWRLQPEFVYSHGLNNLHDVVNSKYDWAVGRVVRDKLTLRVLFWKN